MNRLTRRVFLGTTASITAAGSFPVPVAAAVAETDVAIDETFPSTAPARALEMVGVAHFDLDRVGALLSDDRSLAHASVDWGFGDWESALGAASHMGRSDIARLLMDHGARANLFTLAMMDKVDAVKAICLESPGIQKIRGPHGITLYRHAVLGKASRVVRYLETMGGANQQEPDLGLPDEKVDAYLGTYTTQEHEIVVERARDGFGVVLSGGALARLRRRGEHEFSPAGSPHVLVRFGVQEGRALGLTIHRGRPVLSAARVMD